MLPQHNLADSEGFTVLLHVEILSSLCVDYESERLGFEASFHLLEGPWLPLETCFLLCDMTMLYRSCGDYRDQAGEHREGIAHRVWQVAKAQPLLLIVSSCPSKLDFTGPCPHPHWSLGLSCPESFECQSQV